MQNSNFYLSHFFLHTWAQLSYDNDYMGSSQDALFQFYKDVDWKYALSDINMIKKVL